jgi:hypothetical protein
VQSCNRILGIMFAGRFVPALLSGVKVATWRDHSVADVGTLLWVRETYASLPGGGYVYRADDPEREQRWRPSIHCPRSAARIWLRVVGRERRWRRDASQIDARAAGFRDLAQFLAYPAPGWCVVLRFERCDPPLERQLSLPFDRSPG